MWILFLMYLWIRGPYIKSHMILQLNVFLKQRPRFEYKRTVIFERILLKIPEKHIVFGLFQKKQISTNTSAVCNVSGRGFTDLLVNQLNIHNYHLWLGDIHVFVLLLQM